MNSRQIALSRKNLSRNFE